MNVRAVKIACLVLVLGITTASSAQTLTTLFSFDLANGADPFAGLVEGLDGNLYGTTQSITLFSMTPAGTLTTLFIFDNSTGFEPLAPIIQDTDGNFYGTTYQGGVNGRGNVFRLVMGLSPFVETRPASGKVGASVEIIGNHLKGASSVTFNGISAAFTVVSDTCIRATVPQSATTGTVSVVTPLGTLNGNVKFVVK